MPEARHGFEAQRGPVDPANCRGITRVHQGDEPTRAVATHTTPTLAFEEIDDSRTTGNSLAVHLGGQGASLAIERTVSRCELRQVIGQEDQPAGGSPPSLPANAARQH